MKYYEDAIRKYIYFDGIASRKEYWMFFIVNILISALVGLVSKRVLGSNILTTLYTIFIFCPNWAISIRRLHDAGLNTMWILVNLIPGIGQIIFFILMLAPSKYSKFY